MKQVRTMITRLKKKNFSDAAIDQLRSAIIFGDFEPGERLLETALADQLGISRVPVREALRSLETEGIVIKNSVRGYEVWTPTQGDIEEIVSLRFMLEANAYESIKNKITQKDYHYLVGLMDDAKITFEEKEFRKTIVNDRMFHQYLIEKSAKKRNLNFWCQIMTQWEMMQYRGSRLDLPYNSEKFVNIHVDILNCLVDIDVENATRLLDKHCELSKKELIKTIS